VPAVISGRAEECLGLLETWQRDDLLNIHRAKNAASLFRLWAANNFVFTGDRMSLDWRLRNAAVIASVINGLLDSLKRSLSSKKGNQHCFYACCADFTSQGSQL